MAFLVILYSQKRHYREYVYMPAWLLITSYYLRASKLRNLCYFSTQQVAPQAAKTMSPQFTPMGGFVGGPTNTFGQMPTGAAPMPTGAAPTATSGANYSQMNARASLNNNGFGRLCVYCVWGFFFFFFSVFFFFVFSCTGL